MSLYNMVNGVKQATFIFLPMLGKHPDEYPRFRDCFLKDEEHPEYDNKIQVYTRVGGGNRDCGFGEDELMKDKHFVATFDDSYDNTYATYVFNIPQRFYNDFKLIKKGKIQETSDEYKNILYKVYPKLKTKLEKILTKETKNETTRN